MRAKSASPQETPTLASPGPTKQELQQQIDELNAVLRVTEEQRDAAYRELWKAADSSGRDLWNTYFGLLLGRAEKIEQFQKTVEEAEIAYESGKVVWGVSKTWEAMKQLGELVQREVGTVASVEIPKMPTNEKEARAFAKDVLEKATELGSDARAYLRKLGSAGDAMQQLEDDNVNIAQLKREISDLDARKASAPPPAAQRSSPTPAPLTPRTAEAKEKFQPPQQNLWGDSGSGSRPKL